MIYRPSLVVQKLYQLTRLMRRERPSMCPGKRPFQWPREVAERIGIDLRKDKRIHCPRCGRHVTSLVLEHDGRWSCRRAMVWGEKPLRFRGCYTGRIRPHEGMAAEYAFGLYLGLRTKVMRVRRDALATMVGRLMMQARTPQDLMQLAEISTLLEIPLRAPQTRGKHLPARVNAWSPFWLALRGHFVDAYVDSLLDPAAFAMRMRVVVDAQAGLRR